MSKIENKLFLVTVILLLVIFALATRGCYQSDKKPFRDTVTVVKTDTIFSTEIRIDTVLVEVEKLVRVEVPTLVRVEVPTPSDTVYLNDPNIAEPRVYSDTVPQDNGLIWYNARTIGFLSNIELGYKANVLTTNTTVTNNTTVSTEKTQTITLNRSRLYLGADIGVLPRSITNGTSASNLDIYPSIFWGNQTMGVRVGYGLLTGHAQFGYFRKLTLFERK